MRRRLFNLAAAVSLALCVATAALWVRSYWRRDSVQWARYVRETEVARHEEEGGYQHLLVVEHGVNLALLIPWQREAAPALSIRR